MLSYMRRCCMVFLKINLSTFKYKFLQDLYLFWLKYHGGEGTLFRSNYLRVPPLGAKPTKKKRNNCSICMTTINPHGKLYTLILYVNVRLLTRLTLFKCQKCGYWRLRSLRVILTTRLTILYLRIKRYSCVKGLLIFFLLSYRLYPLLFNTRQ